MSSNLDLVNSSKYYERCEKIWSNYKLYSMCAATPRMGFELTGITYPNKNFGDVAASFYWRGESVLEHQAKTAWLTSRFISNFPNFFSGTTEREVSTWAWNMLMVGLCHDAGEVVNGDIPDDGRPEHDAKDGVEMKIFRELSESLNPIDATVETIIYERFQRKNSFEGRALYAIDKLEAVLTLILLETYGKFGSIANKSVETRQDKYYEKIAGTDNATDVWGVHMIDCIWGYPDYIVEPVLTLFKVALLDVRKRLPDWWDREYLVLKWLAE